VDLPSEKVIPAIDSTGQTPISLAAIPLRRNDIFDAQLFLSKTGILRMQICT
jgi:hypothetical protein|tara:strand:+ start:10751 stop:10906 length:156 start_codon:yes stop_codon:yes gene_type:complete